MSLRRFALALALGLGAACPLRAELTPFWRPNPITSQAIASDPTLGSMQSWSLMVTNTNGDFRVAGLRAVLPEGNYFYRHPFGSILRPTQALISLYPALEFHTYVTSPQQFLGRGLPTLLGGFPETEPHSMGGAFDPIPGTFSLAWIHPKAVVWNLPPGTFELMRATFPIGVVPQIHPQSGTVYENPVQDALFPTTIPEPATGLLAMLIAAAGWRARRPRLRCSDPSAALPGAPPCLQSH